MNGAIIYLERTPYFDISGNNFNYNQYLYVAGLTSLTDFVEDASGLQGVLELGGFEFLDDSVTRMLPLIFSNLGLSFKIYNNTADTNSVRAGLSHQTSGCASTLEFSYLAAHTATIELFSVVKPATTNL